MAKRKKSTYAMSRRTRSAIFALCLLLFALLVWLDHGHVRRKWQSSSKSEEQVKARDFEKYHGKTFTVASVVDGDTIDINVPDGRYEHTRIRLWGIDTPETQKPNTDVMYFGVEAAEYTTRLAFGKQVTLYLENHRSRGKYGRLLAYVKLPDGPVLNEVLLREGFAYADLRFHYGFYNKYKQLEAASRSRNKGLWEKVTREQLPEWMQRENPNLLKKR